jgi:hypothetical protein
MTVSTSIKKNKTRYYLYATLFISLTLFTQNVFAQTEVEPWGNITGIRVDGQLMEFETSLQVINNDWSQVRATAQERQQPKFIRDGNKQTITTRIDSFYFKEDVIENIQQHEAKVVVGFTSKKTTDAFRLYYCIKLPSQYYKDGSIEITDNNQNKKNKYTLSSVEKNLQTTATVISCISSLRQLQIAFDSAASVIIKKQSNGNIGLYIALQNGAIQNGEEGEKSFTVKASGTVDKEPVTLTLNTKNAGDLFAGFGGNFRLQNPKLDPQVIDYCLNNMRVAFARVEMPWMFWQPVENSNPIDSAKAGKLHPHEKESMEMAQRLSKKNIPIILSAWFPPKWAVVGELHFRHQPGEPWGNPLDSTKANEIYKSITDYILYLKDAYGVDVKLFSFNESDLGINVRQTGEEHAALIKGLGAYFETHGLKTKMLLGDNSDATTYSFIYPAMHDAATHKYIGAISFHSWRGWDTETLQKWRDAATQMRLPLIVGEGSIDAAAWNYPQIFQEQIYALKEINLYTRLMAICQPLSILQWQLTADYSPLKGGGIFGDNESLQPTQRFWNLKQLASVPENLYAMPVTTDASFISCAAQGDNRRNIYAVHIVNNGAERMVTLKGLPHAVKKLSIHTTSKNKNMKEQKPVAVVNGEAKFKIDAVSYTTAVSE